MAASGIDERRATLARLKTLAGGRVWQGVVDDEAAIPRTKEGKIYRHAVIDFGAPIRSLRERNLTNPDLRQPHILSATVACIAGTADDAQALMDDVVNMLVDWAPSGTSDPWELKNGYGGYRQGTSAIPSRFIQVIFLETTVNLGITSD